MYIIVFFMYYSSVYLFISMCICRFTNLPARDEPFHLSPICSEAGVGSVVRCGGRAFTLVPLCGQKEAVSFFLAGLGNILGVRDSYKWRYR